MYERRRQAASPVSLLVVTLLSVWACSSGGHGDVSVTTSGGAGSSLGLGSASSASSPAVQAAGEGGTSDPTDVSESGSTGSDAAAAGAAGDVQSAPSQPDSSAGESGAASSDNNAGGSGGGVAGSGASVGGTSSKGGAGGGSAGAPFVAPVCAPSTDASVGGASPTLYLPCDVNAALSVCRNCHSNPPTKPANSSYVTYADIKGNASAIYYVVRTSYMPLPPYKLSVKQQQTVLTWLGQDGSCAVGAQTACQ